MMNANENYGSAWNKWDLHIHTKGTSKNDQFTSETFDEFCNAMFKKALEKQIAVIGITDYFSIENYKKVNDFIKNILPNSSHFNDKEKQQIKQIVLIPNVELRMLPATDKGKLINIHCLFDPKYVSKLDNDFFNAIEFSYGNRKYRMNKNDFIELGKAMGENNDKQAYKKGIENFAISHADLQKISAENAEFRKNTIFVTSNSSVDGASGIQEHYSLFENDQNSSLEATRRAIYQLTDMIFSSNEGDIKYFSGLKNDSKEEVIKKCGSLKPCIHGSDAHTESKLFAPDNDRYCWVKAKPSFDGLKQVIYENERVYIGKESPTSPLYKLEKVQLNFDENVLWDNEKKDKFCFADFNQPLYFSPYFTCIIGGRGSGKSTLLNLIANKIDKLDNENKKKLPKDSKEKVIVEPNILNNIEFLAQNEIEEFATNSIKFTQAIFERLDKNSKAELSKQENLIREKLQDFDRQIKLLIQRDSLHKKLQTKKQKLNRQRYIIKTFKDESYLADKTKMQKISKELLELNSSKERLKRLFNLLTEINNSHKIVDKPQNMYDKVFNESLKNIQNLIQIIKPEKNKYQQERDKICGLEKDKQNLDEKIHKYLQSKGLSENNIQDLQNVGEVIEILKNDIDNIKLDIKDIKQQIIDFKFDDIDKLITNFNELVRCEINKINSLFQGIENDYKQDIKTIRIEYTQNNMFEAIIEEFMEILKQYFQIDIREKVTFKAYIKELELGNENLTFNDAKEKINNFNKITETAKILKEIFSNKLFFSIYHLLMVKNIRDIKNIKNFNVYYDDKILSNASFGQRCTAVIVTLLSLGNNSIIMDEPEAHLDSSLIANYLVELIKEQKQRRQIIFATHNANFVLNADAELIIKLNNEGNKITAKSFSIEDSEHKADLLKLEGGKEAFKKRERKYEI